MPRLARPCLAALSALVACSSQPDHRAAEEPPETAGAVDLERYQGRWYEIARYPNRFEKDCFAVTADYTLREDGRVGVVNTCRKGARDGPAEAAEGVARRVGPAMLEVKFAPSWVPFGWGDYWVLALEDDYSAALVGSPDGKYLWILSRTPTLSGGTLERMIAAAAARGYATAPLEMTPQPPA